MLRENYVFSLEVMNSTLRSLNDQRIDIIYYGKDEQNKIDPTESKEFEKAVENNLKRLWNKSKEEYSSGRLRAVQDGWQSGEIAGIKNEIIGKHIIIKQFYNRIQTAFIAIKTQNVVDDRWKYYIQFTGRFLELWDQKGIVWKPNEYPEELPEALPAAKPMEKPKQEQKGNNCRESMFNKKDEAFIISVFESIKKLQANKATTIEIPSVLLIDTNFNVNTFTYPDFPDKPATWQTYINVYPTATAFKQLSFNEEFSLLASRGDNSYGIFVVLGNDIYDLTQILLHENLKETFKTDIRRQKLVTNKKTLEDALSKFKCTFNF